MKTIFTIIALFFSFCVYADECNPNKGQTCSNPVNVPATPVVVVEDTPTTPVPVTKTWVVKATVRAFDPSNVYINIGDSVQWANMVSHNVKSIILPGHVDEDGSWAHEGFRSKLGDNFSYKFEKRGLYGYICEPHVGFGMVGFIIVGPTTQADIDRYKNAYEVKNLRGPFRRLIGKLNKIKPTVLER
jgi:plastocyanin